ncbi:probable glutathione S-transferase [Trifolium pratense]|uniref:probable glutathione S-transferase n=1 Tax=Trifolium pratense TaxID=57577 RepID=UPI001E692902|nr:probable glutathione S-transferase [Trifolium pratense]
MKTKTIKLEIINITAWSWQSPWIYIHQNLTYAILTRIAITTINRSGIEPSCCTPRLRYLAIVCGSWAKTIFIPDEKEREKAIEELYEALQFLENELKDKFFGGDKIGFVDIAALFIPLFQEVAEKQLFTSDKFPKLHKWSQDFYNHPVVKETMPSKEQQFAYFKARAASLAAPSK